MTTFACKRRTLLKSLAGSACLAGSSFSHLLLAASDLEISPLSDSISLLSGAGGNIVILDQGAGLTLVDSGSADQTTAVMKTLRSTYSGKAVSTLFNTHWHADHTGGNEAFHKLGATIVAHENTRLWLGADFEVEWRNEIYKPRPAAALPDTTYYDSGSMAAGDETIDYLHFPQAHTDGDLCLYFRNSNIMVAGGLLSHYRYPVCDIATGGWIGGLIEANKAMLEIADDNTLIVPDEGPALRKSDLQAQYDMLSDLYETMKELARQGFSGRNMLTEGVTAKYDQTWGNPEKFVLETYRGMWAHTYDMGGFI